MYDLWNIAKQITRYSFCGWIFALLMMTRLPSAESLEPILLMQPIQEDQIHTEYTFDYKGHEVKAKLMANYTLYGLIVSQNKPEEWFRFNVTHNSQSVNTRDICVVYGNSLKTDEYKKVRYSNDDWQCQVGLDEKLPHFNEHDVSNNHLIADTDAVRKQIHRLRTGDQVEIRGKLATYKQDMPGAQMHYTSLTRTDSGTAASEIILVESIDVLHSSNAVWDWMHFLCFWTFSIVTSARVIAFLMPRRYLRVPRWITGILRIYFGKPQK